METPFAITLAAGSSLGNKTGSWRVERPIYVDRLPPCNDACPAGENVQGWLYAAEEGEYERAWRLLAQENPMPATMGRVCYHPCRTACNRGKLDEEVGINAVERFLGDQAIAKGWSFDPGPIDTDRRVLVVGSGPASLSAAYHLRRAGHSVVIQETADAPGGMMRYGIPRYRLPRDVLDAEVERILATGVELHLNRPVEDLQATMTEEGCDAAFLGVGAGLARNAYVPAGDSARIIDALSLLSSTETGEPPVLGRRVVVYGGGNTAMDAARTARRLGATDAVVVYRRTRDRMPAQDVEIEEAQAEGVSMRWLSTITRADDGAVQVERMVLDSSGLPQPTGDFEELGADAVVLAIGQSSDLSLVEGLTGVTVDGGVVKVGPDRSIGYPGVFAGGDMVEGERTVTSAIGGGKAAARAIDAWLWGEPIAPSHGRHPLAAFERINPWYYSDASRTVQPELFPARRASTFDEVVGGLSETNALYEARRCLSCGNCFECDNCFGVCPDNAVVKLGNGQRYRFDYDYCKGCGLCAQECPCGAIDMVPEEV